MHHVWRIREVRDSGWARWDGGDDIFVVGGVVRDMFEDGVGTCNGVFRACVQTGCRMMCGMIEIGMVSLA